MNESVVLYSTGCPKCTVLKKKLDAAKITYSTCESVEKMTALGLKSAPALAVGDRIMNFGEACKWVGNYVSELTPSD